MTDKIPNQVLTTEQVESIGGGLCTGDQIVSILGSLTSAYESLVDFTSHVMERVMQ